MSAVQSAVGAVRATSATVAACVVQTLLRPVQSTRQRQHTKSQL
jgi:hypothetical protein